MVSPEASSSQNTHSGSNVIIKNTVILYLRMAVSMIIGLFTGRIVLQTLGVEDYGINNLVGGVIGMFGFIQTSMIGATSRFITYELGTGDKERMKKTFATTLNIHIIIAFIIFLLLETIGLWLINYQLVIPPARLKAANIVFQAAVISVMLGITQTPYGACIVAHEKFSIYAYFDILGISLKLLVLYVLMTYHSDKLILYSVLCLLSSTLMLIIYRIYCIRHFAEARFQWIWEKKYFKPILSFSGWDLFGNMAVMARTQGVSIVINLFFGPLLNAASGVAGTVQGVVTNFSNNIMLAAKPQMTKRIAEGSSCASFRLMSMSIKICFLLLTFLSVPLICNMQFVLGQWLGTVPEYAAEFAILGLLFSLIGLFPGTTATILHATGRIKSMSITNSIIYLTVIPVSCLAFSLGLSPWFPVLYNTLMFCITGITNAFYIRKYMAEFSLKRYLFQVMFPCLLSLLLVLGIISITNHFLDGGWLRLLTDTALTGLSVCVISNFVLPAEIRRSIKARLKRQFSSSAPVTD